MTAEFRQQHLTARLCREMPEEIRRKVVYEYFAGLGKEELIEFCCDLYSGDQEASILAGIAEWLDDNNQEGRMSMADIEHYIKTGEDKAERTYLANVETQNKREEALLQARLRMRTRAKELQDGGMQCNCDLDNWEPEQSTGHSWVCRIHKAAIKG